MSDVAILENQVAGLEQRLRNLRGELALFQKAKGLEEAADSERTKSEEARKAQAEVKAELEGLKSQKARAVAKTCGALAEAMGQILSEGQAVMRIEDDGSVFLGQRMPDGRVVPHAGLSGGQRVLFDAALAHALLGKAPHRSLILEAAELDPGRLAQALEHMAASNPGTQIVINSCHAPAEVPAGWSVVEMGADHGNA
jgi:chromosome segregation ATPase